MKNRVYLLIAIIPFFLLQTGTVSAWQFNITPQFRAEEEFNDNLFLSNNNEEEEYITRVSLGFTSQAKTKNSTIEASYFPWYNYYGRNTDLSDWSHRADLSIESKPTQHTWFKLLEEFAYLEDPYYTGDVIRSEFKGIPKTDYTIRKDRENYMTNKAQATFSYETQAKHVIEANYVYQILKNDDETIEDSQRNSPSLEFIYNQSAYNRINLSAIYTRGDFEVSEDFDQWEGDLEFTRKMTPHLNANMKYRHYFIDFEVDKTGYQVYDPSVGFSYQIGKQTDLSLDAGFFYRDAGAVGDESGPTGNIEFEQRFEKGSIALTGYTGPMESYFGAENLGFAVAYNAGIRFVYQLSKNYYGNASAGYNRSEYKDEDRIDEITMANLGLTYTPSTWKWLMFNVSYNFRNVDSTDPDKNYTNNRMLLTVTLTPQRPYKWNF